MSGLANAGLVSIDAGLNQWRGTPNGAGYVGAVTRLPQGFLDDKYRNGLGVVYMANHEGHSHVSIGCHAKNASIKGLARNWSRSSLDDAVSNGEQSSAGHAAVMGSQELGEFCYAIFRVSSFPSTTGSYSEHLVRFNQAAYVEARYHHARPPGFEIIMAPGTAYFYPESLFNLGQWNTHLHVADTFPPKLWYVSGDQVIHWVDYDDPTRNQAPYAQRWRRQQNLLQAGPYPVGPWRIKFQGAHFIQRYIMPSNIRGPVLVCPWSNHTADPELWYFVKSDKVGGYAIYRASWRAGEWKLPPSPYGSGAEHELGDGYAVIEDDQGGGTFPDQNPNGYAFEHDWRKESNLVGYFYGGPRDGSLLSSRIKIVRDARRLDRLHMIVEGGSSPDGHYAASYYAMSNNDGATWSRLRRMSPYPLTSGPGVVHGGSGDHIQGTVDASGLVVVPGRGEVGGVSVRSLLALNPNAGGVASNDARPYVFRRGDAKGSQWL